MGHQDLFPTSSNDFHAGSTLLIIEDLVGANGKDVRPYVEVLQLAQEITFSAEDLLNDGGDGGDDDEEEEIEEEAGTTPEWTKPYVKGSESLVEHFFGGRPTHLRPLIQDTDALREARMASTQQIPGEQGALDDRLVDAECQMVAGGHLQMSIAANFERYGSEGPADGDPILFSENYVSVGAATCCTRYYAYVLPLSKVYQRQTKSSLPGSPRTAKLQANGNKPVCIDWSTAVGDAAFFHQTVIYFLLRSCGFGVGRAIILEAYEVSADGLQANLPSASGVVLCGADPLVPESLKAQVRSILAYRIGGSKWASDAVSWSPQPPRSYNRKSPDQDNAANVAQHFRTMNERKLAALLGATKVTSTALPPKTYIANRSGFWYPIVELTAKLEDAYRSSGNQAAEIHFDMIVKNGNERRKISMVARAQICKLEDARAMQETFEGFSASDRFTVGHQHGYSLAQRLFGITHNKKGIAGMKKLPSRITPEGSGLDSSFLSFSSKRKAADGTVIEFPFCSEVLANSPVKHVWLQTITQDPFVKRADKLMTGTDYTLSLDAKTFSRFVIRPGSKFKKRERRTKTGSYVVRPPPPTPRTDRGLIIASVIAMLGLMKLKETPDERYLKAYQAYLEEQKLPPESLKALQRYGQQNAPHSRGLDVIAQLQLNNTFDAMVGSKKREVVLFPGVHQRGTKRGAKRVRL